MLCHNCATPAQMKETPLIRCAHNGHLQAVKLLLAKGADVNSLDLVGHVPWYSLVVHRLTLSYYSLCDVLQASLFVQAS